MNTLSIATFTALLLASAGPSQDLVVEMSPCKGRRALTQFFVIASKTLVLEGTVNVGGEDFTIYLPRDKKNAYSIEPRPQRKRLANLFTSTYLSVDQNHDGEIALWESYFAEFPLRIGDSMFDVVAIAKDGSTITLRPSDSRLAGAVIGRIAPDFEFTTTDGQIVRRDDFAGKAVVIDVWAPT